MSSPTSGSDPNPEGSTPQAQPSWDAPHQQPPAEPAPRAWESSTPSPPQGYQPAPSFTGSPAGYGAPGAAGRPPLVLTAAILGFVVAFFALIGALGLFALSTLLGILALFGVLYLALAAVNIWGGILAITGKGSTVLKIGGLITAGLALLGLILALTQSSFSVWSILIIAAGLAIFFLLQQPQSQQWFAAKGNK